MGCHFLGSAHASDLQGADFVICPFPYDATASYGAGARNGPARIIEASAQLELFDEELEIEPFVAGIHSLPIPEELPIEPAKALALCKAMVGSVLKVGKIPVLLGGDHSVTIGAIEAVTEALDDITLLQLDAHTDMRDRYQDCHLSHACVARRALEHCHVVQAGIRSTSKEEWNFLKKRDLVPIHASSIRKNLQGATEDILSRIKTKRLYVTIDVDCLSPSLMPATGTPEPGGLDWYDLLYILKKVAENYQVVGFDLVELAPVPGIHHPEFTCARLIYKMMGYIYVFRRKLA